MRTAASCDCLPECGGGYIKGLGPRVRRLMEEHPGDALSWYASGCYYMACGQVG